MPTHNDKQRRSAAPAASRPSLKPSVSSFAPPIAKAGTQGGGQALDRHTSAEMSARFGHDFSKVRIHTDTRAGEAAGAVGANAFALGSDIVFGKGQYQPGSSDTERLLAHELTHVVQQDRWGGGDWGRMSHKGDASEREADSLASQVMLGRSVDVLSAPGAAVARMGEGDFGSPLDIPDSLLNSAPLPGIGPLPAPAPLPSPGTMPGMDGSVGYNPLLSQAANDPEGMMLNPLPTVTDATASATANTVPAAAYAPTVPAPAAAGGAAEGAGATAAEGGAATAAEGGAAATTAAEGGAATLGAEAILPVAVAGAAGVGAGMLLDAGVNKVGQAITGDDQGDYSISNGLAHVMTATDNALDGGKAGKGLADLFTPTVDASGKQDTFMDRLGQVF